MVNAIEAFDAKHLKPAEEIPAFRPGDTVEVNVKIKEGNNSRIQAFTGVVIARQGGGVRETFVVRKISFGTGVERRFPVHSPSIDSIGYSVNYAASALRSDVTKTIGLVIPSATEPFAACVAPSCTTCATCAVRPLVSSSAATTPRSEFESQIKREIGSSATRRGADFLYWAAMIGASA